MQSLPFLIGLALTTSACIHDSDESMPLTEQAAYGIDLYATQSDCDAAKASNQIPPMATCRDELLFCPSGTFSEYTGDVIEAGQYTVKDRVFRMTFQHDDYVRSYDGTVDDTGALYMLGDDEIVGRTWKPIDVATNQIGDCN